MSTTLGDALPAEMARVRKLQQIYAEIGPEGTFARMLMEHSLRRADKAVMEGDVVAMIACLEDLRGFKE